MSIYENEKIEKITDRIKKVGSQLYQDLTTYITAINLAFGKVILKGKLLDML